MSEALGVPDTLCAGASAMFLQEVLGQYPITKRRLTSIIDSAGKIQGPSS